MSPKRKKKKRSRRVRAEVVQVDEPSTGGATVATTDDEPDADGAGDVEDAPDTDGAEGPEDIADAAAEPDQDEAAPSQDSDAEERRPGRPRGRQKPGKPASKPGKSASKSGKPGKSAKPIIEPVPAAEAAEPSDERALEEASEADERRAGGRKRRHKATEPATELATEPVEAAEVTAASDERAPEDSSDTEERRPGRRRRRPKVTEPATEPVESAEVAEASDAEGEELAPDEGQDSDAGDSDAEGEELAPDDDSAGEAEVSEADDVADEAGELADEVEGEVAYADNEVGAPVEEGAVEAGATDEDEGDDSMARRKSILESLLFASDKPLSLKRMSELMHERQLAVVHELLESLIDDYRGRGIELFEVAGGWQFRTASENSSWVQQLVSGKPVRLSRAQLETMAIVAYRQPITRPEIDEIRGVDSGGTLKVLLDRNLIRVLGKKEEAGRPLLYGTTKEFLTFFNLNDLRELPTLREYHELTEDSRRVVEQRLGVSLDDLPGKGQIAVEGDSEDFAADVAADLARARRDVDQADEAFETEPGEGEDWPAPRIASEESEAGEGEGVVPEESEAGEAEGVVPEESEADEGEGVVPEESEAGEAEGVAPEESKAGEDEAVSPEESEAGEGEGFAPEESEASAGDEVAPEESEASAGADFAPDAVEDFAPDTDVFEPDAADGFAPDAAEDFAPDTDVFAPDAGFAPEETSEVDVDAGEREATGFSDSETSRVDDETGFEPGGSEGDDADAFAVGSITFRDVLAAADSELEPDEPGGPSDDHIDEIAARVASEMPLAPEEDPLRTWPDVADADAAAPASVAADDDSATHEEG